MVASDLGSPSLYTNFLIKIFIADKKVVFEENEMDVEFSGKIYRANA